MKWIKNFNPSGHSFLGGSHWNWINYDVCKFIESYKKWLQRKEPEGLPMNQAIYLGTELHRFADTCIKTNTKLTNKDTVSIYVNDAIDLQMESEQLLYFSTKSFGTTDTIQFKDGKLNIHDLKTGTSKLASFHQLEIYAAYFCLNYDIAPKDIDIELRIYQFDNKFVSKPQVNTIVPIMDKIVTFDAIIFEMGENGDGTFS